VTNKIIKCQLFSLNKVC